MADRRPDDEAILAALEQQLSEDDPDLDSRFADHAAHGSWPVRAWTITWLAWISTWFTVFLATHNQAALVLAATSAITGPTGLTIALRWRARTHQHRR